MTHWYPFAILIAAFGIAGCNARPMSNQVSFASTQPSVTSEVDRFFHDPHVRALAAALERSDWAGAEKALRAGADVNAIGKEGMYPLVWTMYVKNKAAFEWMLSHGANPDFDSDGKASVLFWSAKADDPDWLRMLLAHKANPNLTHKTSIGTTETPLLAATSHYRVANLKLLIAAGADINYQQPKEDGGGTPAIDAAGIGFYEGVYVLLEAGADIRPRTVGGWDVTYEVARRPMDPWRDKVLHLLRDRGADVDGALKAASNAAAKDRKDNPWRYH